MPSRWRHHAALALRGVTLIFHAFMSFCAIQSSVGVMTTPLDAGRYGAAGSVLGAAIGLAVTLVFWTAGAALIGAALALVRPPRPLYRAMYRYGDEAWVPARRLGPPNARPADPARWHGRAASR